ncbi:polyphenol oxidase family protein [Candidatus Avelusimicrobium sp.]|uniref:polyphenol oxidase family protein n=1 Tax=Candidatus Avelusimicrobium sp. TaxID=3048833 RepID=UPI003D7DD364
MKIYTDNQLLATGLRGGTLPRHTGNMRETAAQTPVYQALGIPADKILHFHQTHSDKIISISSPAEAQALAQKPAQEADAWLLANCPGWGAAILTADCVPLFLWDTTGNFFALAHCGWRGVVKQLPYKTAEALKQSGAKGPLFAYLGPHIQKCCFEVQADTACQFSPQSVLTQNNKIFVDLTTEIRLQLEKAGLTAPNIHAPDYCTCCDKDNFFSWRRDHIRQNLLSFIYKPL